MDTRVLLGHKCAVNMFVLVLVVLLALCSACAAETDAAPDSEQADALVAAGNTLAPAAQDGSVVLRFEPAPQHVTVGGVTAVQLRLENV